MRRSYLVTGGAGFIGSHFVKRLAARRDHYLGARCHYWVFEEAGRAGSFIEFIEAADADTLGAALAGAPDPMTGARVYHELEMD